MFGNQTDLAKGDSAHRGREPSRKELVPQQRGGVLCHMGSSWLGDHPWPSWDHWGLLVSPKWPKPCCVGLRPAPTGRTALAKSLQDTDPSSGATPKTRSPPGERLWGSQMSNAMLLYPQLFSQPGQRPQIQNQMETKRPSPASVPPAHPLRKEAPRLHTQHFLTEHQSSHLGKCANSGRRPGKPSQPRAACNHARSVLCGPGFSFSS